MISIWICHKIKTSRGAQVVASSECGQALILVIISMAILIPAALATSSMLLSVNSQLAQSSDLVQIGMFQSNLVTLIQNSTSWDRTTSLNTSMSCLASSSQCTDPTGNPLQNQPFAIYDGSASVTPFYDSTQTGAGLTLLATFTGYVAPGSSAGGNDNCPFRYNLTWSAVCTPPNCSNPQVLVNATLIYSPEGSHPIVMNPNRFSINLYPDAREW